MGNRDRRGREAKKPKRDEGPTDSYEVKVRTHSAEANAGEAVSYTHLTLPTICSV